MSQGDCGDLQFTDNLKGTYSIMWTVPEFSKLKAKVCEVHKSRVFYLRHNGSTPCRMAIYPGGADAGNYGFVCCALLCDKRGARLRSSFALLDLDGKRIPTHEESYVAEAKYANYCYKMIERENFFMREPRDTLVIVVRGGYTTAPIVPKKDQLIRIPDELSKDYTLLYESGRDADAVIAVDGQEIKVHSLVLSARSKVFSDAFSLDQTQEQLRFEITDFKADIVNLFLQFLYCGTVRIDDVDAACELFRAAHAYGLDDLKKTCARYLYGNMDERNVVRIAFVADANDAGELRSYALDYFANCKKDIDLKKYESELIARPKLMFDMLYMTRDAVANIDLLNNINSAKNFDSMTGIDFEFI